MNDNIVDFSKTDKSCQLLKGMLVFLCYLLIFRKIMKKDIHPKYYPEAKITCACGNIIITGSTKPEIKIEVCSACHPFYTGKKRLVDTAGQLDRFQKRFDKSAKIKADTEKKAKEAKKKAKAPKASSEKPKKAIKKSTAKKPTVKKTPKKK
jgi:large subunit ribosomal protein L31